jgi:hypothetical protein
MKINPFRPRSVDSIIDVFARMEADLEKARAFHDSQTEVVSEKADDTLRLYDAFVNRFYDFLVKVQEWADRRVSARVEALDQMSNEHFQEAIRANDMKGRIQALLGKRDD